jgi:hypothetical protein
MRRLVSLVLAGAALGVVACGGSSDGSKGGSAGALSAEAQSAATGDIPDNQVFLTFRNRAAGYSMKNPEGWARTGPARDVTFQDKNNIVHVVVGPARRRPSAPSRRSSPASAERPRAFG